MADHDNYGDSNVKMMQRYLRPAGRGSSMDEATLKREDAGVSLIGHHEQNQEAQKEKPRESSSNKKKVDPHGF